MNTIWEKLYELAINKADLIRSSRHAAAFVSGREIVSMGVNKIKSHPLMYKFSVRDDQIYLHAEIDALIKAISVVGQDHYMFSSMEVYVARVNKMGKFAISRPCEECCMLALKAFHVPVVHYTTGNPDNPVTTEFL